jgi:hypothetical protein
MPETQCKTTISAFRISGTSARRVSASASVKISSLLLLPL